MSAWKKYGPGLYMLLLHANFLSKNEVEQRQFASRLQDAATGVPAQELDHWLRGGAWPEMLTAAWIVGLTKGR